MVFYTGKDKKDMSNLVLIVGNGLTIDLLKCISKEEEINIKNSEKYLIEMEIKLL